MWLCWKWAHWFLTERDKKRGNENGGVQTRCYMKADQGFTHEDSLRSLPFFFFFLVLLWVTTAAKCNMHPQSETQTNAHATGGREAKLWEAPVFVSTMQSKQIKDVGPQQRTPALQLRSVKSRLGLIHPRIKKQKGTESEMVLKMHDIHFMYKTNQG